MWQLSFPMGEEAAKKLCKDQAAFFEVTAKPKPKGFRV